MAEQIQPTPSGPPIFIISGGTGASGALLTRTAVAQFAGATLPIRVVPHVQQVAQLETVVKEVAAVHGTLVHTLVDGTLRAHLVHLAREHNVVAIDLMGQLLARLAQVLQQEPAGEPGLYRQLHEEYFARIEAVDFAVRHDDGCSPQDWPGAEMVLVGASRVGKTPLSMVLAIRGWRVANVPVISQIAPPPALFHLDPRRVVGLTVQQPELVAHRQWRQRRVAMPLGSGYTDPGAVDADLEAARQVFRRGHFAVVDMTDKPIEDGATEIITLVTHALRREGPPTGQHAGMT